MINLTLDQLALEYVEGAIAEEQDAKQLKRELGEQLKEAVEPAIPIIRGELMSMGGSIPVSPPLRLAVSNALTTKVRYSGPAPGVRVAIGRKGMPRGFDDAARKINQGAWLHPLWGREGSAVMQTGVNDFFDGPLQDRVDEMRAGVERAVEQMAQRLAARAGG
jgi:hypothetical protein